MSSPQLSFGPFNTSGPHSNRAGDLREMSLWTLPDAASETRAPLGLTAECPPCRVGASRSERTGARQRLTQLRADCIQATEVLLFLRQHRGTARSSALRKPNEPSLQFGASTSLKLSGPAMPSSAAPYCMTRSGGGAHSGLVPPAQCGCRNTVSCGRCHEPFRQGGRRR